MGAVGNYQVISSTITVAAGATGTINAPSGTVILSVSGFERAGTQAVSASHPSSDGTSWSVTTNASGFGLTNWPYSMIVAEMAT